MFSIDIANALVNLYMAVKKDREFQAWVKLVMSTVYSGVIAFLGVDGMALVAGVHWLVALGSGMVAAAVSITAVLLRTPQGRGLALSLPPDVVTEVQKAQNSGEVNIGK